MLHFRASALGYDAVWGQRTFAYTAQPDAVFYQQAALHPNPLKGQRLGGIGFFRNAFGQPRFNNVLGAYQFNTYVTTYKYADGQYSLAAMVSLVLTETLNLHDSLVPNVVIGLSLSDGVTLHDSLSTAKITFATFTEHLTLHDALISGVVVGVVLTDDLLLTDSYLTDMPLLSYVVNANTKSLVKYNSFNFDSYANIGGTYFGIKDDGIYELGGDTDDGAVIAASIKLGKQDFGSEMLKSMQNVYVGTKTNGDMILKVVTDTGDTYYYTMTAQTSGDLQTNRVITGKGLRSRYWQFELTNVNGGDLTFDSISFHAVDISRRIGRTR